MPRFCSKVTEKVPAQGPSVGGGRDCSASAFLQVFFFFVPIRHGRSTASASGLTLSHPDVCGQGGAVKACGGGGEGGGLACSGQSAHAWLSLTGVEPDIGEQILRFQGAPFSRRSLPDWLVCLLQGKEWMCQVCRAAAGAHGKHIRSQSASRCL